MGVCLRVMGVCLSCVVNTHSQSSYYHQVRARCAGTSSSPKAHQGHQPRHAAYYSTTTLLHQGHQPRHRARTHRIRRPCTGARGSLQNLHEAQCSSVRAVTSGHQGTPLSNVIKALPCQMSSRQFLVKCHQALTFLSTLTSADTCAFVCAQAF